MIKLLATHPRHLTGIKDSPSNGPRQSIRRTAMIETAINVGLKLGEKLGRMVAPIDRIEDRGCAPQEITTTPERMVAHARSIQQVLGQLRQVSERPSGPAGTGRSPTGAKLLYFKDS